MSPSERNATPVPAAQGVPVLARVWQEDDVWNASAFDLGIAVFGHSLAEAEENFETALRSHFDVLNNLGSLEQTMTRLQELAASRGFFDRVPNKQTVIKFEAPIPVAA